MTATKIRILCILVFLAIYIPTVFFAPVHILNLIFWPIAGWTMGGWIFELSERIAKKYGYE